MTSAPATGCVSSRRESSASAGGQLEHPSDVNSSTTTGARLSLLLTGATALAAPLFFSASGSRLLRPLSAPKATTKAARTAAASTSANHFLILKSSQPPRAADD